MRSRHGTATMGIPIAVMTKHQVVRGAPDGDRLRAAVIADLRPRVLAGQPVRRVDMLVTEETEPCRVGSAVDDSSSLSAEVAGHALSGS